MRTGTLKWLVEQCIYRKFLRRCLCCNGRNPDLGSVSQVCVAQASSTAATVLSSRCHRRQCEEAKVVLGVTILVHLLPQQQISLERRGSQTTMMNHGPNHRVVSSTHGILILKVPKYLEEVAEDEKDESNHEYLFILHRNDRLRASHPTIPVMFFNSHLDLIFTILDQISLPKPSRNSLCVQLSRYLGI